MPFLVSKLKTSAGKERMRKLKVPLILVIGYTARGRTKQRTEQRVTREREMQVILSKNT